LYERRDESELDHGQLRAIGLLFTRNADVADEGKEEDDEVAEREHSKEELAPLTIGLEVPVFGFLGVPRSDVREENLIESEQADRTKRQE